MSPALRACWGPGRRRSWSPLRQGASVRNRRAPVLSSSSVTSILYSIATGYTDRAVELLAISDEISDDEREILTRAMVADDDCTAQARGLGDALRSLGAER